MKLALSILQNIIVLFNSKAGEHQEYQDGFPIKRIYFNFGDYESSTAFNDSLPPAGNHCLMRVELSEKTVQLLQYYFKPLRGRVFHHCDEAQKSWKQFINEC
ncbi:hypothetical protein GEMRC1_011397 [Eukaryota sp. GEM-RC1]